MVSTMRTEMASAPLTCMRNLTHALIGAAALLFGSAAGAVPSITTFGPGSWGVSDATLGVAGFTIENFEDTALAAGLQVQLSGGVSGGFGPSPTLPATFTPGSDDPNALQAFVPGVWDGTKVLINRNLPIPVGYLDFNWGDVTFAFTGGATSVGFSVEQIDLSAPLLINGVVVGDLQALLGTSTVTIPGVGSFFGRNGYIRIDAGVGELINSVTIENTANSLTGDGIAFDHLAFNAAPTAASEPPVLLLAASGLVLLALRRRSGSRYG